MNIYEKSINVDGNWQIPIFRREVEDCLRHHKMSLIYFVDLNCGQHRLLYIAISHE